MLTRHVAGRRIHSAITQYVRENIVSNPTWFPIESRKHGTSKLVKLATLPNFSTAASTRCTGTLTTTPLVNSEESARIKELNDACIAELASEIPEQGKQLKMLAFQIDVLRGNRERVPNIIKKKHWLELLQINGMRKKIKYLNYLFIIEKKQENRKLAKYKQAKSEVEKSKDGHMNYGLMHNTLFLRIYNQTMTKLLNQRLFAPSLYSQNVIFDCSYENFMSKLNAKFCAKQILFSYASNRAHPAPFHLKFCNLDEKSLVRELIMEYAGLDFDMRTFDSTDKSYIDLYPKERLVYLTPHAKNTLLDYHHDDVYIIGAFVDRGQGEKVSLAKAKELKLRMAKLPLDNYLNWRQGVKSLPLNTVLNILLDMRFYNCWYKALDNIPKRCTSTKDPIALRH